MGDDSDNANNRHDRVSLNRRKFLAGAGTAAASLTILEPHLVRGSQANSKIALGMIGCGGRGTWIADLFLKHGGYQIAAAMDYFPDKVSAFGDKFNVPSSRRYTGLMGYKRLLEGKVDAIAIESPPYFHPEQAAAGVDAGVHVYLAKPIAVDVPGCRSVEESGRRASEKKLAFLVDFQTRTDPFYQEAVRRVQKGDIGRIICGEATYIAGSPWPWQLDVLKVDPSDPERRLRAWGVSRALSGDIITEQNIHSIDVATWFLDQHPLRAYGTGGLGSRTLGDCWDHFSVDFWFPNDVLVSFCSKQFGSGWDDICCRYYGTDGTVDTHYAGEVSIKGKVPYAGGRDGTMYAAGAIRNIATFYEDVTQGRFTNPTVAPSVRSNMTTILGRMAAYKGAEVTWDEMAKSQERLDPGLKGLKE
ncbi:MAG TPA: Gfo/Idh/MocA family oxidoreductase [Terriglobia bacterium]|nr:Gfo/Idh/MocA family oxidoreductase [Terriglobia bacterium]